MLACEATARQIELGWIWPLFALNSVPRPLLPPTSSPSNFPLARRRRRRRRQHAALSRKTIARARKRRRLARVERPSSPAILSDWGQRRRRRNCKSFRKLASSPLRMTIRRECNQKLRADGNLRSAIDFIIFCFLSLVCLKFQVMHLQRTLSIKHSTCLPSPIFPPRLIVAVFFSISLHADT